MSRRMGIKTNGEYIDDLDKEGPACLEKVDHPSHYQSMSGDNHIECIDAMKAAFGDKDVATWCKINAFKYIWRSDRKGGNESIEKAIWNLKKYLELHEEIKNNH